MREIGDTCAVSDAGLERIKGGRKGNWPRYPPVIAVSSRSKRKGRSFKRNRSSKKQLHEKKQIYNKKRGMKRDKNGFVSAYSLAVKKNRRGRSAIEL